MSAQIKRILSQFGVTLQKNELTLKAPASDFPKAKHFFVQAMLRINDLYMTSRSKVFSYFLDDIQLFFRDNNIYCSENVQFIGKSGYIHNYDFLFQRSRTKPERLCVAINNPTRTSASNILFAWDDTKKTRQPDSCLIVFLNDENSVPKGMEEAFLNYGVSTILWSQRNSKQNIDLIAS